MKRFICLLCVLCASVVVSPTSAQEIDLRMSDRLADLQIEEGQVILDTPQGPQAVSPESFVDIIAANQEAGRRRGPVYVFFDITGPLALVWIGIGFGGQLLFTGRMLVQWLVSEKHRRSVVPPAFWWMSLLGATMLLAYFTWRRDVVGIFGQATGWAIYGRNLWLIYRRPAPQAAS